MDLSMIFWKPQSKTNNYLAIISIKYINEPVNYKTFKKKPSELGITE